MQKQFDPSLVNFTVYPADPDKFDAANLEKNEYKIIHGVHRYKALQMLDKKGLLEAMPNMKDKVVTCFIVNVKSAADITYGNIRGNDLAAKFVRKPFIHELVFIFSSFRDANNNLTSKATDLIVRFAKLLLAHPDEITALKKISTWSKECFESLISVLKKFEVFGTSDCGENLDRINGYLLRGEKFKVTKEMFILIGKCDPEYFKDKAPEICDGKVSLKLVLEGTKKQLKAKKTNKLVTTLTNYQSTEKLDKKFPGKFSAEVMKRYEGAEDSQGSNIKCQMLEIYCKSVIENNQSEPLSYEYIDKLPDVTYDALAEFDIVVINLLSFCKFWKKIYYILVLRPFL